MEGGNPIALCPGECSITYRRGHVRDCGHVRRVVNSAGYLLYEERYDGPSEELYHAEWEGRWAERLLSHDQLYVVAETERFPKQKELVGFARMQRGLPLMQMKESEVSRLAAANGIHTDVQASDPSEDHCTGPVYDCELMSLFVSKDFQGCGIGTNLLRLVSQLARAEFGPTAFCWAVDSERAREFYVRRAAGKAIGLKNEVGDRTQTAYAFDLETMPPPDPAVEKQFMAAEQATAAGRFGQHVVAQVSAHRAGGRTEIAIESCGEWQTMLGVAACIFTFTFAMAHAHRRQQTA